MADLPRRDTGGRPVNPDPPGGDPPASPAKPGYRVAVFGAGGRTGQLIVDELLAAGYDVTAAVRDPSSFARMPLARRLGMVPRSSVPMYVRKQAFATPSQATTPLFRLSVRAADPMGCTRRARGLWYRRWRIRKQIASSSSRPAARPSTTRDCRSTAPKNVWASPTRNDEGDAVRRNRRTITAISPARPGRSPAPWAGRVVPYRRVPADRPH